MFFTFLFYKRKEWILSILYFVILLCKSVKIAIVIWFKIFSFQNCTPMKIKMFVLTLNQNFCVFFLLAIDCLYIHVFHLFIFIVYVFFQDNISVSNISRIKQTFWYCFIDSINLCYSFFFMKSNLSYREFYISILYSSIDLNNKLTLSNCFFS